MAEVDAAKAGKNKFLGLVISGVPGSFHLSAFHPSGVTGQVTVEKLKVSQNVEATRIS